jgi:hypothetical protein
MVLGLCTSEIESEEEGDLFNNSPKKIACMILNTNIVLVREIFVMAIFSLTGLGEVQLCR